MLIKTVLLQDNEVLTTISYSRLMKVQKIRSASFKKVQETMLKEILELEELKMNQIKI